jgi:dCTP deaminase
MSVIPFVLEGDHKTIVETKQNFQESGGLEGYVILIQNLERNQILDTRSSNASYDLRIGHEYQGHNDANKQNLLDGEKIILDPGSAIIVETMEVVSFPKYRFGHIVPKVSLLQEGVSNTSSKVDPGYSGHLLITIFNLGKKKIELEKGKRFCSLYIIEISDQVIAYEKIGKKLPGNSVPKNWLAKSADYIERHPTFFNILLTISTTVLTVATIFALFREPQQLETVPQSNSQAQLAS